MAVGILILTYFILFLPTSSADCSGDVDICEWTPWLSSWSKCSHSCGGGHQTRSRHICCDEDLVTRIRLCLLDCKKLRAGLHGKRSCNRKCYNQGLYKDGRCNCLDKYYGRCCENGKTNSFISLLHFRF